MKQWICKHLRLIISLIVGFLVFAFLLDVAWRWQNSDFNVFQRMQTKFDLQDLADKVNAYRIKHGKLPHTLAQLDNLKDRGYEVGDQLGSNDVIFDHWGYHYIYETNGRSFRIICYGRDRKKGGVGLDCDLANDNLNPRASGLTLNRYASSLTFTQFMETYLGPQNLIASFVAGAFISLVSWFVLTPPSTPIKDKYSYWFLRGLFLLGLSFVVAVIGMILLTATHLFD